MVLLIFNFYFTGRHNDIHVLSFISKINVASLVEYISNFLDCLIYLFICEMLNNHVYKNKKNEHF